jgi:hypothetical protein
LFQLLTQLASATTPYHEAHRDMQGLALHVTKMQLRSTKLDCDVRCEFGVLLHPDQREHDRLKRMLMADPDDDTIMRPTY